MQAISDREPEADEREALRSQLRAETAAREAAEREIAALQSAKRHLEHRVITANRTLAYGLGKALIEARTFKGMKALPARIRQLHLKQKAKRRLRVPDTLPIGVAAHLQFVDATLERGRDEGGEAAAQWLRAQKGELRAKARALTELALATLDEDAACAGQLGLEAARSAPGESRLIALIFGLYERGLVAAPAAIAGETVLDDQLAAPQQALLRTLKADAMRLNEAPSGPAASLPGYHGDREAVVAIRCPPRWADAPRVIEARQAAEAAGLGVAIVDAKFFDGKPAALSHIFADSLDAADLAAKARQGGSPAILDIAGLPEAVLANPASEAAGAARLRLEQAARDATRIVARSDAVAAELVALGLDFTPLYDVPPDNDRWPDAAACRAVAAEFGLTGDGRVIGCIAGHRDDTGLIAMLKAFAALHAADQAAQLVVIGDSGGAPWLTLEAARLGIADAIHMLGQPLPARWPALLGLFDIAVFPCALGEPLHAEAPMWMAQAAWQGTRMLASEAAWRAHTHEAAGDPPLLIDTADWAEMIRSALAEPRPQPAEASGSDALAALYRECAALC